MTSHRSIPFLVFLFQVIEPFGSALASDWLGWRGANRDGVSRESEWLTDWPKSGPEILWRARVGMGFSSFAVEGGRLFTMGHKDGLDTVHCLDTETGEGVWNFDYEAPIYERGAEGGPTATPTLHGDKVYTLSRTGLLLCLDRKSGEKIWERDLVNDFEVEIPHYGFACSPLAYHGRLIIDAGKIIAFDLESGNTIWETEAFKAGYSSPVPFEIEGQSYVANFNADSLKILKSESGDVVSSASWETSSEINVATPIIQDGKIFISSGFGMGCALYDASDPTNLVRLWRNHNMHTHFSNCVLWDGFIYGFDGHVTRDEGFLTCLDFETGETRWKDDQVRKGSLIIAGGHILALLETGELIVAKATPEGFQEESRSHILGGRCWTPPVLSDGKIYSRNVKGDLICLDVRQSE
ncbi:MAG: PQQ-binding-like beta-propeller repeat protein [Candidatus Omnitrophica bacterium]|nr:PQQ-binding-like beta-propeller repeat protein [Candidatus Omnitrophota bacterium]